MIEKIKKIESKLIQAQIFAYLIGNKKVSKVLKSSYIKDFTKIFNELPLYYNSFHYEIDLKKFFNIGEESNNIVPNFISTTNFIDYNTTLNFTIKNKHLVDSILNSYNISLDENNFKIMKKILSGKLNSFEFLTNDGNAIIVDTSDLEGKDLSKKQFKEQIVFSLPNSKNCCDIQTYPLVFTHVSSNNSKLIFDIFSEEDIMCTEHFAISKAKLQRFLSSFEV